jgi:hypothetical protein
VEEHLQYCILQPLLLPYLYISYSAFMEADDVIGNFFKTILYGKMAGIEAMQFSMVDRANKPHLPLG